MADDWPLRACQEVGVTMSGMIRRTTQMALAAAAAATAFLGAAASASADSTDDYPIPHRIIVTTCDVLQYMAAARDTSPVYFELYIIDRSNRPADVQQMAFDRIHWFFSL